jgi:hypothetical protein
MFGALLFSLLASSHAGALDADGLKQAMETAAQTHDASALVGRKFHIVTPFANPKTSKYPAFKQTAQWRYDDDKKAMVTAIGLGEITDKNFEDFKAAKLDALPPLQSLYIDVDAHSRPATFRRDLPQVDAYAYDAGRSTKAASFGLAIPFKVGGPSAMPEGFLPLMTSIVPGSSAQASRWAAGMIVVFDGEIIDPAKTGVFCSSYHGQVGVDEITGQTRVAVDDDQCFITARIDRVQVIRDGQVLADWRKPPSNPY